MENLTKWEYKSVKLSANHGFMGGKFDNEEFNRLLNDYGDQGWELTNTVITTEGYGSSRDIVAIFKRPKRY